jgi:hypothetical protein
VNRGSISIGLSVVAAAAGVTGIITRPFLLIPIGLLFLLVAAKLSDNRRVTMPAAAILALGALAGTAIAVGFTQPLY